MVLNAFEHSFGQDVFCKINQFIFSQVFQFRTIVCNYYSVCFSVQHILVVTTVTGGYESFQWNFPLVTQITYCAAFTGPKRQQVQKMILS